MTAEEARKVEGKFGRIEGTGEINNYPVKLYGTVILVDSYRLLFETTVGMLVLFSLRKIEKFIPKRKNKLVIAPKRSTLKHFQKKYYQSYQS